MSKMLSIAIYSWQWKIVAQMDEGWWTFPRCKRKWMSINTKQLFFLLRCRCRYELQLDDWLQLTQQKLRILNNVYLIDICFVSGTCFIFSLCVCVCVYMHRRAFVSHTIFALHHFTYDYKFILLVFAATAKKKKKKSTEKMYSARRQLINF